MPWPKAAPGACFLFACVGARCTTTLASLAGGRTSNRTSTPWPEAAHGSFLNAVLLINRGVSRLHGAQTCVQRGLLLGDGSPNYLHLHSKNKPSPASYACPAIWKERGLMLTANKTCLCNRRPFANTKEHKPGPQGGR